MSEHPPQPVPADDVAAIVLAGGRSSRFGGPKLGAPTGDGGTVLDRALLAVDQVARTIVLAGPEPSSAPELRASLRATPDPEPFGGPLVAVSGALGLVDADAASALAIVVGGDMPALVPAVLRRMLEVLRADPAIDAVILEAPASGAKAAVLPLALRVAPAVGAARLSIDAGDRSLVRFLARLRSATIPAAEWLTVDPGAWTLVDVDVRADLERLRGNEIR